MRTHFKDQTSLQSNSGSSSDEDSDYDGSIGQPVDWTVMRGHAGKFTRVGPSTVDASLIMQKTIKLMMQLHGGGGAHNPLKQTG